MKIYLEVSISAAESQRELLLPTMIELGFQGFQETETELLSYIEKTRWDATRTGKFITELKNLIRKISANADIRFREIEEKNWNREWEQTVKPIEVGERLVIKPSWCEYAHPGNKVVIEIDPKMSFGTGYHETTRLTLRLLERYIEGINSILDIGTGTGILAIAAVKLGASSAWGIDIDEWSIENALENTELNGVSDKVTINKTPVININCTFRLITANLTLNTNTELLPTFKKLLRESGTIILSGFLATDAEVMRSRLRDNRFIILEELTENDWIAFAARK